MNVLCIGDIVGDGGCDFLYQKLPKIKKELQVDFTIANGENSVSNGNGISSKSAESLFDSGVDFITTGNHVFQRKESYTFLEENPYVIRPANYPSSAPGKGWCIYELMHQKVAVINLMGNVFMNALDNPFHTIDQILPKIDTPFIFVDFHAEATSEKIALAAYLDGKVSAVFGTHTHVQTADERVLPKGTGFITDLGMTGSIHSSLGMKLEPIIDRFTTCMPHPFSVADGPYMINGALFNISDQTGLCEDVIRIYVDQNIQTFSKKL